MNDYPPVVFLALPQTAFPTFQAARQHMLAEWLRIASQISEPDRQGTIDETASAMRQIVRRCGEGTP